jgi:hypothetical protein
MATPEFAVALSQTGLALAVSLTGVWLVRTAPAPTGDSKPGGRRVAGRALEVIGVIGLPIGLAGLAGVLEYLDWTLVAVIQTVLAVAAILAAILLWMSWYRSMKAASRR